MAAQIVGRTHCPECGFESAHVKRSDKTLYRYCPECGSQYMATGARREALLMEKTRPLAVAGAPAAPAAPAPAAPDPSATGGSASDAVPPAPPPPAPEAVPPAPAPRRKAMGLFGGL
jgi:predicted  nucleic acid-binding Zn-ribbon protein